MSDPISPVSGGNASGILPPDINSTSNDDGVAWSTGWDDILSHIDDLVKNGHIEQAVMYITSSLFMYLSDFTETYQMGSESNYMNVLTTLDQYRNAQEKDFDDMQYFANNPNGTLPGNTPGTTLNATDVAQDMAYAAQQINSILTTYSSMLGPISADVQSQENALFPTGSSTNYDGNVSAWENEWEYNSTQGGGSSGGSVNSIQPTANALTALSNDFSSQSSIAQSELKYYQSNDAQYQSIDHNSMQSIIDQEKAMVTAMQGASN